MELGMGAGAGAGGGAGAGAEADWLQLAGMFTTAGDGVAPVACNPLAWDGAELALAAAGLAKERALPLCPLPGTTVQTTQFSATGIGSAWVAVAMAPQTQRPKMRGFEADISNLLFEPKEIALLTISAATKLQFHPLASQSPA
jgi:hypothetical protein